MNQRVAINILSNTKTFLLKRHPLTSDFSCNALHHLLLPPPQVKKIHSSIDCLLYSPDKYNEQGTDTVLPKYMYNVHFIVKGMPPNPKLQSKCLH